MVGKGFEDRTVHRNRSPSIAGGLNLRQSARLPKMYQHRVCHARLLRYSDSQSRLVRAAFCLMNQKTMGMVEAMNNVTAVNGAD
jgi:hypothetical protein